MCGHLRLLNIACAAKAKLRLVTLTKPSRDSPLAFSLLGGQEKGFRIFIDTVEPGSKAAEVGLKRGDQVKYLHYHCCYCIFFGVTFTFLGLICTHNNTADGAVARQCLPLLEILIFFFWILRMKTLNAAACSVSKTYFFLSATVVERNHSCHPDQHLN